MSGQIEMVTLGPVYANSGDLGLMERAEKSIQNKKKI